MNEKFEPEYKVSVLKVEVTANIQIADRSHIIKVHLDEIVDKDSSEVRKVVNDMAEQLGYYARPEVIEEVSEFMCSLIGKSLTVKYFPKPEPEDA